MALSDLYKAIVIDHNREPRNYGELAEATHSSRGLNALCGDDIRVFLEVDGERILRVTFDGEASAITMASASLMTTYLTGISLDQVDGRFQDFLRLFTAEPVEDDLRERLADLAALEGVREYPSRIKSATLPWYAARAALRGDEVASTE